VYRCDRLPVATAGQLSRRCQAGRLGLPDPEGNTDPRTVAPRTDLY